jgi:glycerophosphoryl diester phosphodiesterase
MVNLAKKDGPLVIGHRGASGYMPENTMASFDLAVKMGADMIELDIHPTKDGHLVVLHDETVDRTTDGSGRISSISLEQSQKLNAAAKFGNDMVERIPTLAEALEKYSRLMPIMVEVKHGSSIYPGIERKVVKELELFDAVSRVELISFDLECLRNIRRESTQVKIGFIFEGNMATFANLVGKSVDALHGMWTYVTRAHVDYARRMGYSTHVWTVDSEEEINEARKLGADGIVSNYPDRVLRAIENSPRRTALREWHNKR